ncbi:MULTISPECIES: DUF3592 domain-containing protein [Carnobacterium]|uniref:DUF3592 domain-containing protein n=1 Tax=Carnobacterium antarcticum TaxID=2126436 RepID=A0ABW4NPS6_9LACT|nr:MULTISPECIES: DUF3592 domain-containing protein [unclassified Carnobacterium]QQP70530.1 hypothetical protein JHE06_01530 [Carnobacterium sp. CS13]
MVEMTRDYVLLAVLALMAVLTVSFLTLGIWLYLKERRIKKNSINHILGEVVNYSYNQSRAPVVEYEVNGKNYKTALRYSVVITTSSTFKPIKSKVKGDILDTKLRIRNNSAASINMTMQEAFPLGSYMNVYYNPDKPKESFVERFAPSYIGLVFMFASIIPLCGIVLITLFS